MFNFSLKKLFKYIFLGIFLYLSASVFFLFNKDAKDYLFNRERYEYNKMQRACSDAHQKQIAQNNFAVFIQDGKMILNLQLIKNIGDYEFKNNKCIHTAVWKEFSSKELKMGIDDTSADTLIKIYHLNTPKQQLESQLRKETEWGKDEKRYHPKLEMKTYPLWIYPNYKYDDPHLEKNNSRRYGFGLKSYLNPFTGKPYVMSCSFVLPNDHDHKITDTETIQKKMIYGEANQDIIYPCLGEIYVIMPELILLVEIRLERNAVPYANEIFPMIEAIVRQSVSKQTNP